MTEFLVHFVDENGNQNSDTCRKVGANGRIEGSYEAAQSYGEFVMKQGKSEIQGYKIYQLTI